MLYARSYGNSKDESELSVILKNMIEWRLCVFIDINRYVHSQLHTRRTMSNDIMEVNPSADAVV